MKAPDKLIFDEATFSDIGIFGVEGEVEYIRKEALLEKLEKVAASYKKRSDEGELVWQHMCGINEAINILNEM